MSTRIYAVTQAGGAIIKLHVNIGRHKAPIYFNHDHLSVWICDPGVGTDVFVNDGGERTPWGVTETPEEIAALVQAARDEEVRDRFIAAALMGVVAAAICGSTSRDDVVAEAVRVANAAMSAGSGHTNRRPH